LDLTFLNIAEGTQGYKIAKCDHVVRWKYKILTFGFMGYGVTAFSSIKIK
jgi:hypothetical protein